MTHEKRHDADRLKAGRRTQIERSRQHQDRRADQPRRPSAEEAEAGRLETLGDRGSEQPCEPRDANHHSSLAPGCTGKFSEENSTSTPHNGQTRRGNHRLAPIRRTRLLGRLLALVNAEKLAACRPAGGTAIQAPPGRPRPESGPAVRFPSLLRHRRPCRNIEPPHHAAVDVAQLGQDDRPLRTGAAVDPVFVAALERRSDHVHGARRGPVRTCNLRRAFPCVPVLGGSAPTATNPRNDAVKAGGR